MTDRSQKRFLALLEAHQKIVLKVASIYCWDPEERRDLIQEITMQLWRAFPSYDETRVFSTWMYRIALNVAISFARKAGRRSRLVAPLENSDIGSVAGPTKPEPDERIDALYRSLRGLDPFNRALMMLYLDDRSYLEIADVLGISETNVPPRSAGSSNACAASLHRRHDDED